MFREEAGGKERRRRLIQYARQRRKHFFTGRHARVKPAPGEQSARKVMGAADGLPKRHLAHVSSPYGEENVFIGCPCGSLECFAVFKKRPQSAAFASAFAPAADGGR